MLKDLSVTDKNPTKKMIAVFDIGGTNTRAKVVPENNEESGYFPETGIVKFHISSKEQLKKFIQEIVLTQWHGYELIQCVLDFAGPVLNHRSVRMSNWEGSPVINVDELIEWGLPRNSTFMLNDIEAAAYGVIYLIENSQLSSAGCSVLYESTRPVFKNKIINNKFILMPGTGLGGAGLVATIDETGKAIHQPVASEIGHVPSSIISPVHEGIMQWLKKEKRIQSYWPSWEDFVSGRGLTHIYEALININRISKKERVSREEGIDLAETIAKRALQRKDKIAELALELFFRCAGKAAQVLALIYQPFGGIFLCGDVIRKNKEFIRNSGFMEELHDNATLCKLLKIFPVYIIAKKNLNLIGNFWISGITNKKNILPR